MQCRAAARHHLLSLPDQSRFACGLARHNPEGHLHIPIVTLARRLLRDELVSLRRLAIDRRAASALMPRVWRTALKRNPAREANEIDPGAVRSDRTPL